MAAPRTLSEPNLPLFTPAPDDVPAPDGARALPSYLRDHRARLRARFLAGGAGALADYELLEMLLFAALPRVDVKPLAHRLIAAFGDLPGVIAASPAQVQRIDGAGESVVTALRLAGAVAARMARARVLDRPVISSWDALLTYCHTALAHQDTESFRVLFLDRKNRLIADEEMGRGTVDHVPVYPREVLKRALELNASALILVHNHPSGDPEPSSADIAMTEQIVRGGAVLSITVHDHLIIGRARETSFRARGLLT